MIDNIAWNKDIILVKPDKDRGVAVLNRNHFVEKCVNILELGQFNPLSAIVAFI